METREEAAPLGDLDERTDDERTGDLDERTDDEGTYDDPRHIAVPRHIKPKRSPLMDYLSNMVAIEPSVFKWLQEGGGGEEINVRIYATQ